MDIAERQDIEVELFVRALKLRHGYDFSDYAQASFKRRLKSLVAAGAMRSISELTERVIHDDAYVKEVVDKLSVPVSEMFRNPAVFRALREDVLPMLASHPQINIWQAGCAHGEETYSLAILLKECGLYYRARIFATDVSEAALARAKEGIYPLAEARAYSEQYQQSGGTGSLSDWYTARYNHFKLEDGLRANVTFAQHNLVSDGVFGEMQLVLCRNVLIYFGEDLQHRVLRLFRDSLVRGGYLCLGSKEAILDPQLSREFKPLRPGLPVFRRMTSA